MTKIKQYSLNSPYNIIKYNASKNNQQEQADKTLNY